MERNSRSWRQRKPFLPFTMYIWRIFLLFFFTFGYGTLQNHRIIGEFGLEGSLEIILFQTSAVGRDTSY